MVNYGGNIVVLWEEDFVSSIGSIKTNIWCAEIALERLNGQGIYGKVNWCYVVLTVPKSCSIEDVLVTTF
ncbi:hypothetical protein ISN45_Aa08g008880 [Arabidopsis thaliana x Arabidopsis arenosa]|uniref:Uncharacterized protein n=1 Tax=Arabidopsis thaliana x Arabidopsis arenosa TaxID=1240361 RepID=A0A8T1XG50_9BRAS|nr:hypothetical protein ISN45_Aa08g008880 [Arabidopsis thaliana x Arabidopsis arenosa]